MKTTANCINCITGMTFDIACILSIIMLLQLKLCSFSLNTTCTITAFCLEVNSETVNLSTANYVCTLHILRKLGWPQYMESQKSHHIIS